MNRPKKLSFADEQNEGLKNADILNNKARTSGVSKPPDLVFSAPKIAVKMHPEKTRKKDPATTEKDSWTQHLLNEIV